MLILKSIFFNQQASVELSKRLEPSVLWMIKISATLTYIGSLTGFYFSFKQTSKIFAAENSHRKPTLKGGWLKYHQEKQKRMILAGLNRGLFTGFRWGLTGLIFTCLEFGWERILDVSGGDAIRLGDREANKALKVLMPAPLAGICTASLFSIYNKLWFSSSKKLVLLSALFGSGVSVLEQANIYIYSKSIKRFD